MIKLDASKGLGDAIYLRAVVLHLLERGEAITVFTRWREVFDDLPVTIRPIDEVADHNDIRHVAFSHRIPRDDPEIDQFTMRCRIAGITGPVPLRLGWTVRNAGLLKRIKRDARGRKVFIYQPRKLVKTSPMALLQPQRKAFNKIVADHKGWFRIKLGHPPFVEDDPDLACELDLFGKGFIKDTFDVCTLGELFFGEPCFLTVMAEALDRKAICLFSRRASQSSGWMSQITPNWQFNKRHLATCVYDDEVR